MLIPKLVLQRGPNDCVIAVVTMLTGLPYETVLEIAGGLDDEGYAKTSARKILVKCGYATAFYHDTREPVCLAPHYAEVRRTPTSGRHLVVLLPHSRLVLDPLFHHPQRMSDYYVVNFVAPILPLPGFAISASQAE